MMAVTDNALRLPNADDLEIRAVARCAHCHGRRLIHWHPHWDNGHHPCPGCMWDEYEAWRVESGLRPDWNLRGR